MKYYSTTKKEQWREVAEFVKSNQRIGDKLIVLPDYVHHSFDYYYQKTRPKISIDYVTQGIEETETTGGNVWLVAASLHKYCFNNTVIDTLIEKKQMVFEKEFAFITVYYFI